LIVLWEASGRVCGKRLKSLLSALLPALEHHNHLTLQPAIRTELFSVSAATIDRLLRDVRNSQHAACGMRSPPVLRRVTHPRMDGPWRDPQPGFLHMHLTHADRRGDADRVRTLTITDMFSGWTQCATVTDWQPGAVVESLDALLGSLPFTPRGLALDENSIAAREWLMRSGTDHPIEVIHVSRGQERSRGDQAGQDPILSRLSVATSLYSSVFRGAFGHASATPCARLLASGALSDSQRVKLRDFAQSLDPFELLAQIRALNSQLRSQMNAKSRSMPQTLPAGVPNRRRSQPSLPAGPRSWSTHPNVFERAWPAIQVWLRDDPAQSAKTLLERLKRKFPGVYRDGHLRSLHRRVRVWRQRAGARGEPAHPDSAG
jgi:hypothetical protein